MDNKTDHAQRAYSCARKRCFHKVLFACDGEDGLMSSTSTSWIVLLHVKRRRSKHEYIRFAWKQSFHFYTSKLGRHMIHSFLACMLVPSTSLFSNKVPNTLHQIVKSVCLRHLGLEHYFNKETIYKLV